MIKKTQTIPWGPLSKKHVQYIKNALSADISIAEGAIRSGKTIDHCIIAAAYLETCPDKIHLASGSTIPNAKLNIGDCNGFGLEHLFRGRSRWGKYKDNDALFINTQTGQKIVIFAGGGKADSYKKILGNSYGLWIATEINEHYDSTDSRTSFIKVAMGRQIAAIKPFILWDLNPSNPNAAIYADYIDKWAQEGLANHQLFTLRDNATLTKERKAKIEQKYIPGTVWHRRDILGQRCVAEGLIYQRFADDTKAFHADAEWLKNNPIIKAEIGVDFGGGTSAHAFCCVGYTRRMRDMVVLDEYREKDALDPERLTRAFVDFSKACCERWPVDSAYPDSAEQTLIAGLRVAAARERIPINVSMAIKRPINDRIRALTILMGAGRFRIDPRCVHTIQALQGAVWDSKSIGEDKRLDNGTTNIDSLDALEYAYERDIYDLVER